MGEPLQVCAGPALQLHRPDVVRQQLQVEEVRLELFEILVCKPGHHDPVDVAQADGQPEAVVAQGRPVDDPGALHVERDRLECLQIDGEVEHPAGVVDVDVGVGLALCGREEHQRTGEQGQPGSVLRCGERQDLRVGAIEGQLGELDVGGISGKGLDVDAEVGLLEGVVVEPLLDLSLLEVLEDQHRHIVDVSTGLMS